MSGSQFCFLVLHYPNARRSLPRDSGQRHRLSPAGARSPRGSLSPSFSDPVSLVQLAGSPVPISKQPPYSCPVIGREPLAPDERPGSPSPEMELSEPTGRTGRLTRQVLSKAGGYLTGDTCFILIYKPFPGKQACPGRARRPRSGWNEVR